jgi:hypothetical protein
MVDWILRRTLREQGFACGAKARLVQAEGAAKAVWAGIAQLVWAGVAQLVEHLICNQGVGGSNPFVSSSSTRSFGRV